MRNSELPIDYEALTPGPTGYYRNLTVYPQIFKDWSNERLSEEIQTLHSLLETQPRNFNNQVRIELMDKAFRILFDEVASRIRNKEWDDVQSQSSNQRL